MMIASAERVRARPAEATTTGVAEDVLQEQMNTQRDPSKYLELPTKEEVQQCIRNYRESTSNEALQESVCVVCTRRRWTSDGSVHRLSAVTNLNLLRAVHEMAHADFRDGVVLSREHVWTEEGQEVAWFCRECLKQLEKNCKPRLSLANGLWIGPVPSQLSKLTVAERLLIALHYPRCYVYKLYPKGVRVADPSQLQRGMTGNVTTYPFNMQEIAGMLEGALLPRTPAILPSLVAVTYVGAGKVQKKWLRKLFQVRRHVVYEALLWLRANNRVYTNLTLNEDVLSRLPLNDVPEEVLTVVRQNGDVEVAQRERAGYTADDDDFETDEQRERQSNARGEVNDSEDSRPGESGDEREIGADGWEGEIGADASNTEEREEETESDVDGMDGRGLHILPGELKTIRPD